MNDLATPTHIHTLSYCTAVATVGTKLSLMWHFGTRLDPIMNLTCKSNTCTCCIVSYRIVHYFILEFFKFIQHHTPNGNHIPFSFCVLCVDVLFFILHSPNQSAMLYGYYHRDRRESYMMEPSPLPSGAGGKFQPNFASLLCPFCCLRRHRCCGVSFANTQTSNTWNRVDLLSNLNVLIQCSAVSDSILHHCVCVCVSMFDHFGAGRFSRTVTPSILSVHPATILRAFCVTIYGQTLDLASLDASKPSFVGPRVFFFSHFEPMLVKHCSRRPV